MAKLASQSIVEFLRRFTHSDISEICTTDLEYQVNVQGGYPIRIPKNAATDPINNDAPLNYDPNDCFAAVGTTWWNWRARISIKVAYDFDFSDGHDKGFSQKTLDQVVEAARRIPWVTIRKSTSGKGIHLEVPFLNPPATKNHTEHTALAHYILARMCLEAGFDFRSVVDAIGGNMWIWAPKMYDDDENVVGLILIRQGEPFGDVPDNWRDYVPVAKGERSRLPVLGDEGVFDQLATAYPKIAPDDEHRKIISALTAEGFPADYDADRNMIVTHTAGLKVVHQKLNLKGIFQTVSTGKDQGDKNCYAFPAENGALIVFRFSPGAAEATTWRTSEAGWTFCTFNKANDLPTAAEAYGAILTEDDGYIFDSFEAAQKALHAIGVDCTAAERYHKRETTLRIKKGRLHVTMPKEDGDVVKELRKHNWSEGKSKKWVRVLFLPAVPKERQVEYIRHMNAPGGEKDCGFTLRVGNRWVDEPRHNIKSVLRSRGMSDAETEVALGGLITDPWKYINRPFQTEYPGNRQWNRHAARLAYAPSDKDPDEIRTPHWDMVLNQCGIALDDVVRKDDWCQKNGVKKGSDYLFYWSAILFQQPFHSLPYLFFYSEEENSGKSTFHQALGLLMTKGYVDASSALTEKERASGVLDGAVLCYVEELDLGDGSGQAYKRIKNYVTAEQISVRHLYTAPFMAFNSTHWVHTANKRQYCPVFEGDSRIVFIHQPPLKKEDRIEWKEVLKPLLIGEAPDFLRRLLSCTLPPPDGRLWLPPLETVGKKESIAENAQIGGRPNNDINKQLLEKVQAFVGVSDLTTWEGTFGELAQALQLNIAPNRLSALITKIEPELLRCGIGLADRRNNSEKKIIIGPSYLVEQKWSDEQLVEDEERVSKAFEKMSACEASLASKEIARDEERVNRALDILTKPEMNLRTEEQERAARAINKIPTHKTEFVVKETIDLHDDATRTPSPNAIV